MSRQVQWFEDFFKDFRPFFGKIPAKATNAQVKYLIKKLKLKPGMSFLDCPCGVGRVSIPLAKHGVKVVGVDLCQEYLGDLKAKATKAGLKIETLHRDMRKIDFSNRFDCGGNLWTSFGYFESERDSMLVLKKMYRALKPGGKFCLHVINRDFIIAHYTESDFDIFQGVLYTEKRYFDYATSTNRGVWTFYKDGTSNSYAVGIRMYSYHELLAMFKQVGFVDIEGYGNETDRPIDRNSMMMWIFGTKPK
jgi:cyclopropane fatty-acyl-phospholipid synthase-like methyltransferase